MGNLARQAVSAHLLIAWIVFVVIVPVPAALAKDATAIQMRAPELAGILVLLLTRIANAALLAATLATVQARDTPAGITPAASNFAPLV